MGNLKTCCCGCASLKTGVIIIGWLGIAANIFFLIALTSIPEDSNHAHANTIVDVNDFFSGKYGELVASSVIDMLFCILLIFGASKGEKWFLMPSIIFSIFEIIGSIVFAFMLISLVSTVAPGGIVFLVILISVSVIGLDIYILLVVTSHFNELKRNESEQRASYPGKVFSDPSPAYTV